MHYFRKYFFRLLEQKPKSCITQIIHELQAESEEQWDLLASNLLGVTGVWLAVPIAELITMVVALVFLHQNREKYHYA